MGYVTENLMPGERVVCSAQLHPAVFLPAAATFILSVFAGVLAFVPVAQDRAIQSGITTAWLCLAVPAFIASALLALQAFILVLTTEFAVTDRRVIAKKGLIRRHTLEMLLTKVESVAVRQGILGRLLGFGTVTVTGTGGTREPFGGIAGPLELRMKINQCVERATRAAPAGA